MELAFNSALLGLPVCHTRIGSLPYIWADLFFLCPFCLFNMVAPILWTGFVNWNTAGKTGKEYFQTTQNDHLSTNSNLLNTFDLGVSVKILMLCDPHI